jgi:hypothetical protein
MDLCNAKPFFIILFIFRIVTNAIEYVNSSANAATGIQAKLIAHATMPDATAAPLI